jgi:hypothetical protein
MTGRFAGGSWESRLGWFGRGVGTAPVLELRKWLCSKLVLIGLAQGLERFGGSEGRSINGIKPGMVVKIGKSQRLTVSPVVCMTSTRACSVGLRGRPRRVSVIPPQAVLPISMHAAVLW